MMLIAQSTLAHGHSNVLLSCPSDESTTCILTITAHHFTFAHGEITHYGIVFSQ